MDFRKTWMGQEIAQAPRAVEDCFSQNAAAVAEVAKEIRRRKIRQVILCARGTSDNAAFYGKYAFELLCGIPVTQAAPSVLTSYGRRLDMADALVIGVSQSGRTQDVIDVVTNAKQQGALTVGITNMADSPLASAPDYALLCAAGEEKSVAATKTFVTELYLLARLAAAVSDNSDFAAALDSLPAALAAVFENAESYVRTAQRYRFVDNFFVLARGTNYPVALEAALKIQETTYIPAKAFASSDFYHGPFAMVEEGTPVLLLAPRGELFHEAEELLSKLLAHKADVLVLSDDAQICEKGAASLRLPVSGSDLITPFYCAVAAQLFACALSLTRGNNPDQPRSLNKVCAVN